MDNKNNWLIGVALLLVFVLFAVFFKSGKRYNWRETYDMDKKDPYGLYIIHKLLDKYSDNQEVKPLDKQLNDLIDLTLNDSTDNYVFIGNALYLDSVALSNLISFVEEGNNVFIASKTIPTDFMEIIYPDVCYDFEWTDYIFREDSVVSLNLMHPNLQDTLGFDFGFFYKDKPKKYFWKYIDPDYFCDTTTSMIELGSINDLDINFAKKDFGKGSVYLHTTPITFTNFNLVDSTGFAYAGNVFSHLSEGNIYWDEENKVPEKVGRRKNNSNGSGGSGSGGGNSNYNDSLISDGPLTYILSNPGLKAAWYLLLATALFYLLFRTRRKQRIIPVLEANRNTSLDFISTIGSLYFMQNDHRKLSRQQGRLFLNYIRTHYDIPTQNLDEDFKKRLAAKSEVSDELIEKITTLWTNLKDATHVSEKSMVDLYKLLNHFYKTCK